MTSCERDKNWRKVVGGKKFARVFARIGFVADEDNSVLILLKWGVDLLKYHSALGC